MTLKQVPDELLTRLRDEARRQRRSLNQQALFMLEAALAQQRPSFLGALDAFFATAGRDDWDVGSVWHDVRAGDKGREVDL